MGIDKLFYIKSALHSALPLNIGASLLLVLFFFTFKVFHCGNGAYLGGIIFFLTHTHF